MPYSNIVYVKLFLDLFFGDNRFRFLYRLSDQQQLLYIKLLALAGATQNEIPNDLGYIAQTINYKGTEKELAVDLKAIEGEFAKLHNGEGTYKFRNFDELHNYIATKRKKGNNPEPAEPAEPVKPAKTATKKKTTKEPVKEKTNVFFEEVWKEYPSRVGKKAALKSFLASVKTKEDFTLLKQALETYKLSERVMKGYVQNGRTWFANWQDWLDYSEDVCPICKNRGEYQSVTPRGSYKCYCKCPAGDKFR